MQAPSVAQYANDIVAPAAYLVSMLKQPRIHQQKQPRRPHYVEAWAERRGLTQADLARELGVDKGTVSRWYSGTSPGLLWQENLAALFSCEREDLFRHPDENWMKRFLEGRSAKEIEHIRKSLEITFPKRTGTDD